MDNIMHSKPNIIIYMCYILYVCIPTIVTVRDPGSEDFDFLPAFKAHLK